MPIPEAYVFDAYGTLFDVHSVLKTAGIEEPPGLSALWRQKQLEYTWLRSLMGRYEDFWSITGDALRSAAAQLGIELSAGQIENLLQAYLRPSAFADAKAVLEQLSGARLSGARLAILSNGSPEMLASAVRHNGMESIFQEVISADRVKIYKPSPRVYALGTEILNLPAGKVLFVSSNSWDAAGAKAFGYQVCWSNRSGAPMEHLGFAPDITVSRLDQIPDRVNK